MPYIITMFPGFLMLGKTKVTWLSSVSGRPAVLGELLSITISGTRYPLTFENHDTLLKAVLYCLSWIAACMLQVLFWIALIVWSLLSLVYLIPLTMLGIYLFLCKVISVGPVWNFYFRMWAGSSANVAHRTIDVDTGILNLSLLAHLCNTGPQFFIQISNNTLTKKWTPIGYFSTTGSILYALAAIYRYGYYWMWRGFKLSQVPNEISLGGFCVVKLDAETEEQFVTTKLEVENRKIRVRQSARRVAMEEVKRTYSMHVPPHESAWSMLINHKTSIDIINYFTIKLKAWGSTALEEASANDLMEILMMVPDKTIRQSIMQVLTEMPDKGKELEALWIARMINDGELEEEETGDEGANDSTIYRMRRSVSAMSGRFTEMMMTSRRSSISELTSPRRFSISSTYAPSNSSALKNARNNDDDDDTHIIELAVNQVGEDIVQDNQIYDGESNRLPSSSNDIVNIQSSNVITDEKSDSDSGLDNTLDAFYDLINTEVD